MFPQLPTAALRLAYLTPEPATSTVVDKLWASSMHHAREMETHFGVDIATIEVGGYPWEPAAPAWEPRPGSVLLATSVSVTDDTGGSVGSANEILYRAGELLQTAGVSVTVAPHPREDRQRWRRFALATCPTLEAAAESACVVTVAGTAIEAMARIGVPLAIIPTPLAPQYLYEYGTVVRTAEEAADAVRAAVFASA